MGGSFNSPFMFYFFKKERVKKKTLQQETWKNKIFPKGMDTYLFMVLFSIIFLNVLNISL